MGCDGAILGLHQEVATKAYLTQTVRRGAAPPRGT